MKVVVIYQSKTGFTKKYAEWIAEELRADLFARSEITAKSLDLYDTVIFGGGLYVVGINGVKFIKDNLAKLKGKKVVVFTSGCTPTREHTITEVRDKNFTPQQQKQIGFFYLRGGFDYSKLNAWDKLLMTLLKWKIMNKKHPTADERGMLAAYNQKTDFTQRKNIEDLISYVNSD